MKNCKIWKKCRNKKGYGKTTFNGKYFYVHRLAWELKHGPLKKDICVLHKCDNPPCYRLSHLFLGSRNDNNQDMVRKKRHTFGERNPKAKLTLEKVKKIRNLYKIKTITQTKLAKQFGVSRTAITEIINKNNWR